MFIFGTRKMQNSMLKQIVVGVLILMVATTSFLNAIAHFDLSSKKRDLDTHQQKSSFKSEVSVIVPEANLFVNINDETNIKIQIPPSNQCQDADETHLCIMAIMSKNLEFASHPFEINPIQYISDKALSNLNLGPYRPPASIL